jgi:cysteine desulfurase
VSHTVEYVEKASGVKVHILKVSEKGEMDFNHLSTLLEELQSEKVLVTLMHANNEIGTMLNLEKLAEICNKENVMLHTDTVQTIGHSPIDLQKIQVNFLSGSGHKLHGPKGIGFIYINGKASINAFIHGGSQERNMRAGTENLYGIVGLGKAIESATEHFEAHRNHILDLKKYMMMCLEENFQDIKYNGDTSDQSLYTVLNVSFPPSEKNEMLLMNLDIAGIAASGGSACTSGADAGSHVLNAIKADPNRKGIRFSFSHMNTREEIDVVIEKLKSMVAVKELL